MAYTSNKNKKVNVQYLQDIAQTYRKSKSTMATVDIVTFAEAQWGLNIKLFPVQKFILKTFYGLELDNDDKNIIVPDEMNTKELGRFTETGFMDFLIETGRTNLREYKPNESKRQLVLCCGRRSSKCQSSETYIYTTSGTLTVGQLFNRFKNNEKIGIFTLKEGKIIPTYDINMEDNGYRQCIKIETNKGKTEQTTLNHPYLVWNENMMQPQWIEAKDLKIGDLLACSSSFDNGTVVWEKIEKIEMTGIHKTIAIQVKDTNIIANEIITHNSSIAAIISNYEVYRLLKMSNPQAYFGFPNGSQIAVCTTSVSQDTASTLFTIMKNYCLNCNFLKDKVVNRSREYFTLATENDLSNEADPSIYLICGGARSSSIRGHSNIVVIIDEAAFFPISGQGNGDGLYQALTPSILSFTKEQPDGTRKGQGKVILLSSPYGKSGVFYKKYLESFDFQDSMLMYNMYTAMVNPTVDSSFLRDQKKRNTALFDCEYGAKFSDTISSWMDENTLNKVINPALPVNPKSGKKGVEYYMGIDYAGKNDGAAISIVHKQNDKIILDYADVYYGSQSDVWFDNHNKTYETANKLFSGYQIIPLEGFADEIKRLNDLFPIKYGWFDQFNGYGLLQMLKERGLLQFQMKSINNGLNMQMYQYAKQMISSELIMLPNHPILIPEMLTLQENKSGSRFKVEAPNRTGFHDDIIDSFVIAVNALSQNVKSGKTNAKSIGYGGGYSAANGKDYNSYYRNKFKIHGMNDKRGLY